MQIAICDDEKIITNIIKEKLIQYNSNYQIDTYFSGNSLLESPKIYDLIFLDIEMPEIDGMKVATTLRERHYIGYIIFLTSHLEFMPDAFKVKAFRFLRKPIIDEDFEETIRESEKEIRSNKILLIHSSKGETSLYTNDILYLEAARNITYIYTINEEFETRYSLRNWMTKLDNEHFYQIHKSYIVSLRHIDTINYDGITLKGIPLKLPISRRKYTTVRDEFLSYVKKYAQIR